MCAAPRSNRCGRANWSSVCSADEPVRFPSRLRSSDGHSCVTQPTGPWIRLASFAYCWSHIVLMALVAAWGLAGEEARGSEQTDREQAVPVAAPPVQSRAKGPQEIVKRQQEGVAALLAIAGEPKGRMLDEAQTVAVRALGELRAVAACDFLIKHIECIAPSPPWEDSEYPCAEALISIGLPAIDAILRNVGEELGRNRARLFAKVIRSVDGQELGAQRVEIVARDARGGRKQNLGELAERISMRSDQDELPPEVEAIIRRQVLEYIEKRQKAPDQEDD